MHHLNFDKTQHIHQLFHLGTAPRKNTIANRVMGGQVAHNVVR
jgi:hypothetical protein